MIFVVDTNILFSACLTPGGRIFDVLFNVPSSAELVSSHVLVEELNFHKLKLTRLSGLTSEEIETVIELTLRQIDIFDAEIVEKKYWHEADRLTQNIDSDDISFVKKTRQSGRKMKKVLILPMSRQK